MKNFIYVFIVPMLFACGMGRNANLSYNEAIEKNDKRLTSEELKQDARFLVDAKSYSLLVEELSRLAIEKGYASAVQNYAGKLQQDHQQLNDQLNQIATNEDIRLPMQMSESHNQMLEELRNASRQAFDRQFIRITERIYEDNIQMYKDVATSAYNDEVRAFAAKKLSLLRNNQQRADELEDQLLSMVTYWKMKIFNG